MKTESKLIIKDAIKRGILRDTPEGYVVLNSYPFLASENLTIDKSIIIPHGIEHVNFNTKVLIYEGKDKLFKITTEELEEEFE